MSAQDRVNILLVDDQPSKLLSYEVILAELNENLVRANSAREALEFLLKNEVAVILVDVCMPELDGFELAKMLRDHPRYEKTAIIFISAILLSDLDHVRGYQTGAVDYVPVPVVPEILRAKVRIFAELWRKTRQLERLNRELEHRVQERTAELEASTAQLREAAERLHLASEAAGFGTYDYNVAAGEVYWSPSLRQIVGVPGNEPLTLERALALIHPDHREMVRRHIDSYAPNEERKELEFKVVRPDGESRWLLDRGQAIPAGRSEPGLRVMGTVLDITERKRNEERQVLLMAELDHRVKNILGNVSAVARLSSHRAASVQDFVESLDGRIQAISRAHGLLRRVAWTDASLADLAFEALSPFHSSKNIEIDGGSISIVPSLAQSMALILHELATNAVKHGALSQPSGKVRVSWSRPVPGQVRFVWQESGGPPITAPASKGFGLTVLQTAASDLGAVANYRFNDNGFVYTLQGPFERVQPSAVVHNFPRLEQTPTSPPDAQNGRPRTRILIVEDEALVALQLQNDLEEAGHHVIGPARSLKHGLMLASREEIHMALLDVRLGSDTSEAIAEELLSRKIPFAFATGYADYSMLPEHLRSAPKLSKPYVTKDIRKIIDSLIVHREVPVARHSPRSHE
jgi:PAS domain S-box-containing protein